MSPDVQAALDALKGKVDALIQNAQAAQAKAATGEDHTDELDAIHALAQEIDTDGLASAVAVSVATAPGTLPVPDQAATHPQMPVSPETPTSASGATPPAPVPLPTAQPNPAAVPGENAQPVTAPEQAQETALGQAAPAAPEGNLLPAPGAMSSGDTSQDVQPPANLDAAPDNTTTGTPESPGGDPGVTVEGEPSETAPANEPELPTK